MRMAAFLKRNNPGVLLLAVFFIVSLVVPATREAHLLCIRLLLPLKGRTFVQGQPPGCIVYTIPNVQFTERHRQELRRNSSRSPDEFVLATAAGSFFELQPPPAATWTNHSLLEWGAIRCAWVYGSQELQTNQIGGIPTREGLMAALRTTREIIRTAQGVYPTNGALWIAEALLDFREEADAAALDALRLAAGKGRWHAGTRDAFLHIFGLLEDAGLSKLDAAGEASDQMPDYFALGVQRRIEREIQRLMAEALNQTNDQRFFELLGLVVDLRKPDWVDRDATLQNRFRSSYAGDDLVNAMAKRMGREPLPEISSTNFAARSALRQEIFRDYLDRQAEQQTASRFLGQMDTFTTE